MSEVENKVYQLVSEQFGTDRADLCRSTNLRLDLAGDSLDHVELLMDLEEAFNVCLPDEEVEKFETLGQLIDLVEEKRAAA